MSNSRHFLSLHTVATLPRRVSEWNGTAQTQQLGVEREAEMLDARAVALEAQHPCMLLQISP